MAKNFSCDVSFDFLVGIISLLILISLSSCSLLELEMCISLLACYIGAMDYSILFICSAAVNEVSEFLLFVSLNKCLSY